MQLRFDCFLYTKVKLIRQFVDTTGFVYRLLGLALSHAHFHMRLDHAKQLYPRFFRLWSKRFLNTVGECTK